MSFDEAPLTGALAFVKGRKNALHGPHADAEIADRQTDRGRRPIGLAG